MPDNALIGQAGVMGDNVMLTRHLFAGILLVLCQAPCAHGGPSNDGFTDVVTAPATSPSFKVDTPGNGTFASGVGPVFGQGGLLYIGNEQGTLFALRPDGTQVWGHQLPDERGIKASAVVGADGSIYVVGVTGRRPRQGMVVGQQATLYKFNAGGGLLWQTDFPVVNQENGYTTAPPNIWSSGGTEVIMVPAIYRTPVGVALHLDAFSSTNGKSLADTIVTNAPATTTGTSDSFLTDVLDFLTRWPPIFRYSEPFVPDPHESISLYGSPPLPGVAVFADRRGGAPFVVVSDGMHDVVGYNFQLPPGKFVESFRAHDTARQAASGPMVLPDGHSAAGTDDGNNVGRITFPGPNGTELKDVKVPGGILGTPSRTANGEIVAVGYARQGGFVTMLNSDGILHRGFTTGQTLASAAVSRNHIFVATASALATFEVGGLKPIQLFRWSGGGLWPPAIGPDGRVYAMVSTTPTAIPPNMLVRPFNTLFIFPPPPASAASGTGRVQSGGSIAPPH
jgi:outer membrane protein assembly factor BamB